MGNGLYENAVTSPLTVAAANTDTEVYARNIPGGGLDANNCARVRTEWGGTTPGTAKFYLDDVALLDGGYATVSDGFIYELEIWRTGNTTALVRPWSCDVANAGTWTPGGRFTISGLDWTKQQELTVVARCSTANALVRQRAGLIR